MPIASQEDYDKAQSLLSSGRAKDPARLQVSMQRWERLAMPQKNTLTEGVSDGSPLAKLQLSNPPTEGPDEAHEQGYDIDLSRPDVIKNLAEDPQRTAKIEKFRQLTRDEALQNASKLKVFTDPPDYEPEPGNNPFSVLTTPLTRKYFYEPSVDEFKAALRKDGSLRKHLQNELTLVPNVDKAQDKQLEESTTFKAYQDAAWRHAYADAVKDKIPLSRAKYSQKMSAVGKLQAQALDPAMAFANSSLSGYTMGLSAPTETDEERRSVSRNPVASAVGEVAGALSPRGALGGSLPLRVAEGTGKLLGKAGLVSKGVGGVAKGLAAGAVTGGVDAGSRAVAQTAVEALDAKETAAEAAARLADILPGAVARGTGMGLAFGAGGEMLGGLMGAGAKALAGGQPRDILLHGQSSGLKMGPLGEPVLPKDLEGMASSAAARRATAEEGLAEGVMPKLLSQRLSEQESAASRAANETQAARAKLGDATVDTKGLSEEILSFVNDMPAMTPEASRKRTALQRYARSIRQRGMMTAKDLDDAISEVDSQANQAGKQPDSDWNKVSAILRKGRDEFQFNDPTKVDNYAIRDPEGNVRGVSDYGGMKARQSREQRIQELDNRRMGLPGKLEPEAVRVGPKSEEEAGRFLAERPDFPQVQSYFNTERAVASDVERSRFSRPKDSTRTANATQAQYAANKALSEAVDSGYGYQGTTYRGARLSPEEVQKIITDGEVKSSHMWSTSKAEDHALSFAQKGTKGEPVLFTIEGSQGVSLDAVPGLNTFDEVAVPTGRKFKVADSYRGEDGVLRIKLTDGTRGPSADEATALVEGAPPRVRLRPEEHASFKGSILGTADPKNAITNEKILSLARRSGLENEQAIKNIQRLRDAQNWKQYLGRAISGIGTGGGTYVKANNLLRAVPTLNSFAGGLPQMEASKQAMDVVDRFLQEAAPSWRLVHSRGGQAARPSGAITSRDRKAPRDTLTDEEAQFAAAVIKNLLEMDK